MRFEVLVNGTRVCIAGVNGYGVLNVIVSSVWRNPKKMDVERAQKVTSEDMAERVDLQVGGLDSGDAAGEQGEYLQWHKQDVHVGDEVTVRILSSGESDLPTQRGLKRST